MNGGVSGRLHGCQGLRKLQNQALRATKIIHQGRKWSLLHLRKPHLPTYVALHNVLQVFTPGRAEWLTSVTQVAVWPLGRVLNLSALVASFTIEDTNYADIFHRIATKIK